MVQLYYCSIPFAIIGSTKGGRKFAFHISMAQLLTAKGHK